LMCAANDQEKEKPLHSNRACGSVSANRVHTDSLTVLMSYIEHLNDAAEDLLVAAEAEGISEVSLPTSDVQRLSTVLVRVLGIIKSSYDEGTPRAEDTGNEFTP